MRLYKKLLPIERERDSEENIRRWIYDTWKNRPEVHPQSEWIHLFAVQRIEHRVIGIFWCDIHRSTKIGFVSFWGLLAAHRSYGRGFKFAQDILLQICELVPKCKGLIFAAERVEWSVLNNVLDAACDLWSDVTGKSCENRDMFSLIDERIGGGRSALEITVERLALESSWLDVVEQLRRYRRFSLFVNSTLGGNEIDAVGISMKGYVRSDKMLSGNLDIMADFVQPPIRPPVDPSFDSPLWLFALLFEGQDLPPNEAIEWVYGKFLKSTLGCGATELEGWNEYMSRYEAAWRERFLPNAALSSINLRQQLLRYRSLLNEAKSIWRNKIVQGSEDERLDIQL